MISKWVRYGFCGVVVYVVSLGPVVGLTARKTPTGGYSIPRWVRVVYHPLLTYPVGFVGEAYDHYVELWLRK